MGNFVLMTIVGTETNPIVPKLVIPKFAVSKLEFQWVLYIEYLAQLSQQLIKALIDFDNEINMI